MQPQTWISIVLERALETVRYAQDGLVYTDPRRVFGELWSSKNSNEETTPYIVIETIVSRIAL
jgi:hypothetical protein